MLTAALHGALVAIRRGGLRGVGLALLTFVPPLAVALSPFWWLAGFGLMARTDLVLALTRYLAAHRPEPPPGLTDEDRSARQALRVARTLALPAVRLTLLQFLILLTAPLALVGLAGKQFADLSAEHQVLLVMPLIALGATFLGVAGQRIALERDQRVLVAAAHSLRVARFAYGPLLLLNLLQPAIAAVAVLTIDSKHPTASAFAVGAVLFALTVLVQLVVTAAATEIYLAGPRLDVPEDFGRLTR